MASTKAVASRAILGMLLVASASWGAVAAPEVAPGVVCGPGCLDPSAQEDDRIGQLLESAHAALEETQDAARATGDEAQRQVDARLAAAQAAVSEAQSLVGATVEGAQSELEARLATANAAIAAAIAEVSRAAEGAPAEVERRVEEARRAVEEALVAARETAAEKRREALAALRDARKLPPVQEACAAAREPLLAAPVVLWTSCTMGAGSGLDADTLDGREAQDFLDRITAEEAARRLADASLQEGLDAETAVRMAEDAVLHGRIDGIRLNFEDAFAREAAERRDADLQFGLDLATEGAARRDGDTALGQRLDEFMAGADDRAWKAVLARDGATSTLDADLLDGLEGSAFQRRVMGVCAPGFAISAIATDGAVTCEEDHDTTYAAGAGLALTGAVFSVATAGIGEAMLAFDPATQTELDTHKGSGDHDGRYHTKAESDARFLGKTAKAGDSDRLDGLDSAQFLRSDASGALAGTLTAAGLDVSGASALVGPTRIGGASSGTDNALHVLGRSSVLRLESSNEYAGIRFKNPASDQGYIDYSGRDFRIYADSGNMPTMVVKGGAPGRVGVGTASPGASLDVAGDVRWSGALQGGLVPWPRLSDFPAACPAGQFAVGVGSSLSCATPPSAGAGGWMDDGAVVRLGEAADRVGIGTANPGAKLELGYTGPATVMKVGLARFGQSGGLPFVDAFADVTANAVTQDENTWVADNPARPSWLMRLDAEAGSQSADSVFFNYSPPGASRSFSQKMKLTGDGNLHVAGALQVGGGSALRGIQRGIVGDYVGKTGTSVTFPAPFASAPMVQLTVDESDDNLGATGCRISALSATGFTFWCFLGTADTDAFRVHWLAIG